MIHGKQTIWRLIQRCAENLTAAGQTPFTRGELIRCVRRSNPEYDENSINPIIQGVTDNLKGGAPGAVGKNILHSIARGKFALIGVPVTGAALPICLKSPAKQPKLSPLLANSASAGASTLGSKSFSFVGRVEPETNADGALREYHPQSRYKNVQCLPLNKYGKGPFCKFKIPHGINECGVYALRIDNQLKYIGECENLSDRYNMGYGNISPRNCYRGGQETNCRINNLIFAAVSSGSEVSLWFCRTDSYKALEKELRTQLAPEWNRG